MRQDRIYLLFLAVFAMITMTSAVTSLALESGSARMCC